MNKIMNSFKKNSNSGSTLVTAIIVVAFMSILGTIALYVAGQNYKMKVIDSSNKKSFYESEEVVEVLKAQLTVDVAAAAQRATKAAGAAYVENDNVAVREEMYLKNFKAELKSIWDSHWKDAAGNPDKNKAIGELFSRTNYSVSTISESGDKISFTMVINGEVLKCEINDVDSSFLYKDALELPATLLETSKYNSTQKTPSSYYIKNFNITVTNSKGYVSEIKTSFKITPPALNWDSSQSLTSEKDLTEVIYKADYTDCVLYSNWSKE